MDSGAAAGAGTAAKSIANHFKLFYLDTGKIYRFIGKLRLQNIKKFNYSLIRKKMKILKMKDLQNKNLLSEDVAISASIIAKNNKIRKLVRNFQIKCAYNPPKKYFGSCFIHIGVIFQDQLPSDTLVISESFIIIRYGNAQWSDRAFEIWMFNLLKI